MHSERYVMQNTADSGVSTVKASVKVLKELSAAEVNPTPFEGPKSRGLPSAPTRRLSLAGVSSGKKTKQRPDKSYIRDQLVVVPKNEFFPVLFSLRGM
jgi:hypothetical protein